MKLAFYKGKGGFADKMIRWWTNSKYSHVELVFDQSDGLPSHRLCFSSSGRDSGVRFKNIDLVPTKWDLVPIVPCISTEKIDNIFSWCTKQSNNNHGYAFKDIVRFVLPFINTVERKWFCSEIVMKAIQQAGYYKYIKPENISPQELYELAASVADMISVS